MKSRALTKPSKCKYYTKKAAGLKCRSQVTGQVTGHRPQARSQVRPQATGQITGHTHKNNRTLDKTVLD